MAEILNLVASFVIKVNQEASPINTWELNGLFRLPFKFCCGFSVFRLEIVVGGIMFWKKPFVGILLTDVLLW